MGGHGGLNILPQKRWNVYNYENREKVRRDEEAAAKEEQLKREQSRKRDAELRLEKLRQARGLSNPSTQEETSKPSSTSTSTSTQTQTPVDRSKESESDSRHINLFEGIKIFDPIKAGDGERVEKKGKFWRDNNINGNKKAKREEQVRAVNPEDEKYRMGYGVAGKGVKLPWYMEKRRIEEKTDDNDDSDYDEGIALKDNRKGSGGKKSLEDLREERLKRERMEKEREKALVMEKSRKEGGFSSRRR